MTRYIASRRRTISPFLRVCVGIGNANVGEYYEHEGLECNRVGRHSNVKERLLSMVRASHHDDCIPPKGYVAVCVGEEQTKFVVPISFLHHPLFQNLLEHAEDEFGFEQEGILRIPCSPDVFLEAKKVIVNSK